LRRLLSRLGFTPRKSYCIFNKTRESFVGLNVMVADTHLTRFLGLLGRMRLRSDEGIWVIPSYGVHTIGLPFAVDLIYLDYENRVIGLVESLGGFRVGPVRLGCASVLELANHAIYSSQTQVGDELLICSSEDMQTFLTNNQGGQPKAALAQ
jgi:uncharacterized membrane protein (UPF0127 family)